MIKEFRGQYRFLSNFFPAQQYAVYDWDNGDIHVAYPDNEHFFQANKAVRWDQHVAIAKAPKPWIAKWMGSPKGYRMPDGTLFKVELRKDWVNPKVRINVMRIGVNLKFGQHHNLAQLLVNTHPHVLQEGNRWGDVFWGVDLRTGKGDNWLGKLLMELREQFILAGWRP